LFHICNNLKHKPRPKLAEWCRILNQGSPKRASSCFGLPASGLWPSVSQGAWLRNENGLHSLAYWLGATPTCRDQMPFVDAQKLHVIPFKVKRVATPSLEATLKSSRTKGAFTPKSKLFFRATESHEKSTYRRLWLRYTRYFPGRRVWGDEFPVTQFSPRVEIFQL